MKKIFLFSLLLLTFSCQDSFEDFVPDKVIDTNQNLMNYKDLKVNHRFSSSIDSKNNSILIPRIMPPDGISNEVTFEEMIRYPDRVIEIVETLMNQFPYNLESEYYTNLSSTMIQNDFPLLSNQQIQNNSVTIEEYYSINYKNEFILKYNELYGHDLMPPTVSGGLASFWNDVQRMLCVLGEANYKNLFGIYAMYKARKAENYSYEAYPNQDEANTRRDAYRHIIWNSLLAKNYFTFSSKAPRIAFAKAVTDAHENSTCGSTNSLTAKNMDLHNNQIGRDIFNGSSSYGTVLLNVPSVSTLKNKTWNKTERAMYIDSTDPQAISKINDPINYNKAIYTQRSDTIIPPVIIFKPGHFNYSITTDGSARIPSGFIIESLDNLGIEIGEKLDISYIFSGNTENQYNGGGYDGYEQVRIIYNGKGTVTQSLIGNNKFYLTPDSPTNWQIFGYNGITNPDLWLLSSSEISLTATYSR